MTQRGALRGTQTKQIRSLVQNTNQMHAYLAHMAKLYLPQRTECVDHALVLYRYFPMFQYLLFPLLVSKTQMTRNMQ